MVLEPSKYVSSEIDKIQPRSQLKKHDVLTNIVGASIGRTCEYSMDENANINQAVALVRLMEVSFVPYVMNLMNSDYFVALMLTNQVDMARANLSLSNLGQFIIPVPPLSEQNRIMNEIQLSLTYLNTVETAKKSVEELVCSAKSKILDLAIRGKLVPQDPNDEPASVLLERIRAEKEELIKQGKIKRDKNESVIYKGDDNSYYEKMLDRSIRCIENEIDFSLPYGWQWIRLNQIGNWQAGATPSRGNPEYFNGNIPWLKTGDLNDGYISSIPEYISEVALKETSVKLNPAGSVLIAMYGATIGKLGVLTFPATTNQACCACQTNGSITELYLFYFLLSQRQNFIGRGVGGAQPNISKEKIVATLMALPPINEQKRIVSKITNAFSTLDSIEQCLN